MKKIFTACCLLFAAAGYCQGVDTFTVHFPLKGTTVNKEAATYMDKLIKKGKLQPGQKMIIVGYTDYRGTAEHNDSVSTDRAMNVQAYLTGKGISKSDITQCTGKGKIERPGMTGKYGYAPDRKVQIITQQGATKMDINELKVNETVTLKSIFFEGGLPDILPASMQELEHLYNFMEQNKTVKIQIEGHVCCKGMTTSTTGTFSNDQKLSELRAKAIFDYLSSKGIDKKRMKYVGLGTTKPLVYPANTENEQQQNRRVEIRILSK